MGGFCAGDLGESRGKAEGGRRNEKVRLGSYVLTAPAFRFPPFHPFSNLNFRPPLAFLTPVTCHLPHPNVFLGNMTSSPFPALLMVHEKGNQYVRISRKATTECSQLRSGWIAGYCIPVPKAQRMAAFLRLFLLRSSLRANPCQFASKHLLSIKPIFAKTNPNFSPHFLHATELMAHEKGKSIRSN